MSINILNYDRAVTIQLDTTICLRDCIAYYKEQGLDVIQALKTLGFSNSLMETSSEGVNISVKDLPTSLCEKIICEKKHIKQLRKKARA